MSIAVLFTIAKTEKQPNFPSIKKLFFMYVYIHNVILLSHKKNEILPFVTTWMDLESTMLNEISQRMTKTV